MDNRDITDAYATVYSADSINAQAYLVINFNEEGKQKLEKISEEYVETTDEEGNKTTKKILMTLDGQTIMTTYFGEKMTSGQLQITLGTSTSDSQALNEYLIQGQVVASVLKTGCMPIKYEMGYDDTLATRIRPEALHLMLIVIATIVLLMVAFLIIKYTARGVWGGISFIGFIAAYLLIIRYTNSLLTVNSIIAMAVVAVFDYIFTISLIGRKTNDTYKEKIIKYAIMGIPMYVIAIVFTFSGMVVVSSFGMALFWGSSLMMIHNFIITKNLLEDD